MRKLNWGGGLKYVRYSSLLLSSLLLSQCFVTAQAANSYIPELNVYQSGSSPKIEIGVDMDDADVKGTFGFETSGYGLTYGGSGGTNYGNQSIQSSVKYSGSKALMLQDTLTNNKGNLYDMSQGQSSAGSTYFGINGVLYPNNGQWMSVTYKVRNSGDRGNVTARFQNKVSVKKGKAWSDFKYAETVNWHTPPASFRVTGGSSVSDGATCNVATKTGENPRFVRHYKFDKANSRFVYFNTVSARPTSLSGEGIGTVSAGSPVEIETWPGGQATRNTGGLTNWTTKSCNFQLDPDTTYYNFQTDGAGLFFYWNTNGVAYIDDIKYGFASRVQVTRDGTKIYDDYGSDVVDSSLVVKPNAPVISSRITLKDKIQFKYSASVKQETHNYRARSLGSSGTNPSSWSQNYPVTLVSTPSKYHIKLYKNGTLVKDVDTNTTFEYADVKRGDRLTGEVYTIDTRNQKSNSTTIDYTVGQTVPDLKDDIRNFISSVEDSNDVGDTISQTSLLSLRTNTNIPYSINSVNISKATKYNIGSVDVDASINSTSVPYQKEITNRPIYQTKDEFKSDVTNYIDTGNISSDISFKDFKDNIKEVLENKLNEECKDNPDLNDVEVEIEGTSTEFSSGDAEVKVYYKNTN